VPYPTGLEGELLPHAGVHIWHSTNTAGEIVQPGPRDGGSGYKPEFAERQTTLALRSPQ